MQKYILQGRTPVHEPDVAKWSAWFETADRVVSRTEIHGSVISTVFIGMNHGYYDQPPVLFETLIFGGPLDGEGRRYSTWDEAERGHQEYVQKILESELKN